MSETDSNSLSQGRSQSPVGAARATLGQRAVETTILRKQSIK